MEQESFSKKKNECNLRKSFRCYNCFFSDGICDRSSAIVHNKRCLLTQDFLITNVDWRSYFAKVFRQVEAWTLCLYILCRIVSLITLVCRPTFPWVFVWYGLLLITYIFVAQKALIKLKIILDRCLSEHFQEIHVQSKCLVELSLRHWHTFIPVVLDNQNLKTRPLQ